MTIEQDVTTDQDITVEQTDLSEEKAVTANQEHITVLEQGSAVWNEWRNNNPDVRPELRGAELYKLDLRWNGSAWCRST